MIHTKYKGNYSYAQKSGTLSWYRHKSGTVRLIYVNFLKYPADTPVSFKTRIS